MSLQGKKRADDFISGIVRHQDNYVDEFWSYPYGASTPEEDVLFKIAPNAELPEPDVSFLARKVGEILENE